MVANVTEPINATAHHEDAHRYDPSAIEPKWRAKWQDAAIYKVDDNDPKPKWYSLTMYPYPSGVLHVGHWYAFSVPDVFARLQRMRGFNVLFPMGFDAFGLPAENAAIRNNIHPAAWTFNNIDEMRKQYDLMGAMIDWSREIITCTPEYYQWNQWIFLQMLKQGLAYKSKGSVWWCPNDQTVLANEQVIDGNICERCGAEVYKRDLEQWYFRITDYAEELLSGLDDLDWPERVKTMQRNWIGRSEGARLSFRLGNRRRAGSLHDTTGYGVRRDVYGAGPGASIGREDHDRRSTRASSGVCRCSATRNRDRAPVNRRGASEDGSLHWRLRHQPG